MAKTKRQIIIDGTIEYLISENIVKENSKEKWSFERSYVSPEGSVIILAETKFLMTEKINIEVDKNGNVYDRLYVYYQKGRKVPTRTSYHNFMNEYIAKNYKASELEKTL